MRNAVAIVLALLASPVAAWEFTSTPVCTLSDATPEAEVRVTHDASLPEYTISITLLQGQWPAAPVFAIAFDGPRSLTIRTPRHVLSENRRTITVSDTGFGNVLDGLEFSREAIALSGDAAVRIPLIGIGPAMQDFRACPQVTLSQATLSQVTLSQVP